ncbi:hypothetical protein N7472_006239 [Penicillium cf. griseofulvum]|uniref:Protein kinase domain-containing protein n=1 Tax=Penicillium cf. griseofulvum TaxID=2972120 RepID=A0A9W9JBM4_9EURO|nr:hypothetical protein N7472_006239 [Penicillium cf. griseofulvum]
MPISADTTSPSLRECFAGFAAIAAPNPMYKERKGLRQDEFGDSTDSPILHITAESILIGSVNCVELLSSPKLGYEKAVFEVESGGVRYIAKCWSNNRRESAVNEFAVYERLHELRPSGFQSFARLVFSGDIICSAKFPEGRTLLLEKVPGEQLFDIWNRLLFAQMAHVFSESSSAIQALRSISIRQVDASRHNILYDRMNEKATLVDSEAVVELSVGEEVTSLNPELVLIFGVAGMSQFIHDE